MTTLLRTEAVILHSLNYRDYDLILTAFSPSLGLIKCFFKGGQSRKRKHGALSSPLTRVEMVIKDGGRGDLLFCREITLLSHNLALRGNLATMEAACKMVKTLQSSQLPGKAAPKLYALFVKYLELLPDFPDPAVLSSSFTLKLLDHDGHIGELFSCSVCCCEISSLCIATGQIFCRTHAPGRALSFNEEETKAFIVLQKSLSAAALKKIVLTDEFLEKINYLWEKWAEWS